MGISPSLFGYDNPFEPVPIPLQLLHTPLKTFSYFIHHVLLTLRGNPAPPSPAIRVVCISDTHAKTADIPDGDVLIHAGDLTDSGTPDDIQDQVNWLKSLPYQHIICIAGNHDGWLDPRCRALHYAKSSSASIDWGNIKYLQHSSALLDFPSKGGRRLRVYGAPQIPACGGDEHAFQYIRGKDAWSQTVDANVDILVTHTPPKYHRDLPANLGCEHLLAELRRDRPRLHVFGHVHAGYGREVIWWDEAQRHFESSCTNSIWGALDLLNPRLWFDLVGVAVYGVLGLLWGALWGGKQPYTMLVNAALTFRNTGKLGNEPQVVLL